MSQALERDRGWKGTPTAAELKRDFDLLARKLEDFSKALARLRAAPKGETFWEVLTSVLEDKKMEDLPSRIEDFISTLRREGEREKARSSFEPDPWDGLMLLMVQLVREKKLPAGLSSGGRAGQKNDSPLFKLLWEFNLILPTVLRRHELNKHAFEAAIRRAVKT